MKCPECQIENPETRKFCRECGAKLILLCPQCSSGNLPRDKFCGECGHNLTLPSEVSPTEPSLDEKIAKIQKYLPKGLTEKILSQREKIEGERKQVTVMFCDMEGFTAFTEKLGPEEAYGIMDQIYELLIHKVHDYEGTVNEMTGDGIMALFGAPIALEDAPQRAIRSALAIHREMAKFSDRIKQETEGIPPLKMRIGIHTGPVVVGTLGNDLRVEFKAVGDTVNLASRMEGLAEPGTTFITEDSFKLTEGFFRFEALGEKEVKGKKEPVSVYRVIAPSTRRTRFDVSAERGLTPFVARERELELLLDGFERSKGGRGQAFSIMGEAGVGKSRLLYEFRKAVSSEDATFLEGKCLSYSRGEAYHPVVDILKSNFDIQESDGDLKIRERVKKGLQMLEADETSTLPYLLELLSVKDSGIDELSLSPEVRKDRIIAALIQIVLKGSEVRPLILAYEDLHWVDKSSEESLKFLLDSIAGARVFLIFTYRPEYVHTWGAKSYHSQVNLNRLSNQESLVMVTDLLDTEQLESSLEEFILEKTEGIPFFIEEFIKSVKNLKVIKRKGNTYRIAKDIQTVTIPVTIHDLIMARVDSLPETTKSILQTGSVAGREFNHDLIKRVADQSEEKLLSNLSVLKDSELLYERGIYPKSTYIFKHALTQETVYDSLLLKRRKEVHEKIGGAIEELYSDNLEEHASMLAYHYERAEIRDRAIHYMTRAADRAKAIYANKEALAFYRRAIEQVSQLLREEGEPPKEWSRIATQLHESLGDVLELTGQHDEARDAYESALVQISKHDPIWQARLHHKTGNVCREQRRYEEALQAYDLAETALGQEPAESAPEWWQAWIEIQSDRMWLHYWQVQLHQMTELAEMVRPAVEQYGTPAQRSRFFQGLVLIAWRRDRYVVSKETMAHARASLEAIRESGNPGGIALAQFALGFSYLWRGDLKEAEEHLLAALKQAERIGDAVVQSRCLTYLTILYRKRMEIEEVQHYISRALTVATAGKMLEYISTAKANLAWVMWREGNLSGAQENGRTALEMWQQEPLVYPFQWTALWPLIGVALARDKVFEAVDYARALLEPSQQRLPDALIAVLEEVIKTWDCGESETARTNLNQAIELAQKLSWI
jgi:class 3 adenylate cyclase/tetratricopeptide (TPR) repeat protein